MNETQATLMLDELEQLKKVGRYRSLKTIENSRGSEIVIDGRKMINFSSNNYLGLAHHYRVKVAALGATWKYGAGAGASRLISGNTGLHENLEHHIAKFKLTEAALVYPSGYMANIGVVTSLVGPEDLVIIDRLNHASIIDACRLSKAKIWVYPHKDTQRLQELLVQATGEKFQKKLVITESLFSMDGDIAPLPDILKLCREHGAMLMIDEAHATGVLGLKGRGALEYFSLNPMDVDVVMGTLSKALGSLGGFIAGSSILIEYLRNKSKSFIFTTGNSPGNCGAALKSIQLIENGFKGLSNLKRNIQYFLKGLRDIGFQVPADVSPIIPLITGDDNATMQAASVLQKSGIFAPGIRPPTVSEGEGRIRFSLMSAHTLNQLDRALNVLKDNRNLFTTGLKNDEQK